jgi:hypothetical protein
MTKKTKTVFYKKKCFANLHKKEKNTIVLETKKIRIKK